MTKLERIRATPRAIARHIAEQRPAIVTGLFDGQGIAKLSTRSRLVAALGEVPIDLRREYTSSRTRETEPSTVAAYLAHLDADPDSDRMCVEYPLPPAVRALLEWPAFCGSAPGDTNDARFFLGGRGRYAHLHFDGDHRNVLLFQIYGRKRVVVLPPAAAHKLLPFANLSSVYLERFTRAEQRRFLAFAGASEAVIEPGEAILMPALFWHYVEYPEPSVSFNLRFGRSAHGRLLSRALFQDAYVQNVSSAFRDHRELTGARRGAWQQLVRAIKAPHDETPSARFRRLRGAVVAAAEVLCGHAPGYFGPHVTHRDEEWGTAFYAARGSS